MPDVWIIGRYKILVSLKRILWYINNLKYWCQTRELLVTKEKSSLEGLRPAGNRKDQKGYSKKPFEE